ncbi:MAG: TetR/AcrR family transcriptional regulator, partial [Desulfosudaceae bacterium]
ALLRYYFGSKKGLFQAVAADLAAEHGNFLRPLLQRSLAHPAPEERLPLFIHEFIDFGLDHPAAMSLIMQNIGEARHLAETELAPEAVGRALTGIGADIAAALPARPGTTANLARGIFALAVIAAHFTGAEPFHAACLGMAGRRDQYRQWVKKALVSVFQPFFTALAAENPVKADIHLTIPDNMAGLVASLTPKELAGSKKLTKGDRTRERILSAAETVFTRKSYNTASIRQIGRQGGFDFTIIHHYFPTKEDLARAVSNRIFTDFFNASADWWQVFAAEYTDRPMWLRPAMNEYFARLLDYYFEHPAAPAMLMQNIAQSAEAQVLPGINASVAFFTGILERLRTILPVAAGEETVRMWQHCLVTLIISCVGAPEYPGRMLGRTPTAAGYRDEIRSVILDTFYPGLRQMLAAEG